jgi:hypothetical protein
MLIKEWSCNYLKYSFEGDLHFSLTVQNGAHMLQPQGEEALMLISNAPKKEWPLATRRQQEWAKIWKL